MCVNMSPSEAPPPEPPADLCPELSRCAAGGHQLWLQWARSATSIHTAAEVAQSSCLYLATFTKFYDGVTAGCLVMYVRNYHVAQLSQCVTTKEVSNCWFITLKAPKKTKCNQVKEEEVFCQICLDESSVCRYTEHRAPGHILPAFFKRCGGVFRPVFKHVVVNEYRTRTRPGGLAGAWPPGRTSTECR